MTSTGDSIHFLDYESKKRKQKSIKPFRNTNFTEFSGVYRKDGKNSTHGSPLQTNDNRVITC